MLKQIGNRTYRLARRLVIAALGGSLLVVGVLMLVLPGPAVLVIPLGLFVLGLEFAWARQWLMRIREGIGEEKFVRVISRGRAMAEKIGILRRRG